MNLSEVRDMRLRLRNHLPETRLVKAPSLSRITGADVRLKLEGELPTGSFKPRGALAAVLQELDEAKLPGIVTSSTGNHGAATAFAGRLLGIPVTVFLPEDPNPVKRNLIAEQGAEIIESGRDSAEALLRAKDHAATRNLFFLHDGCEPRMLAGTAAIACEVLEQEPRTSTIYVPVGDTNLIRGLASAAKQIKPGIQVVGVQAERAPAYYLSWKEGRAVTTETCDTVADGLATRLTFEENVAALRELVDDMVLVSEEEMVEAVGHLRTEEDVVAEPAGAATTAALLKAGGRCAGRTVALIVSGSNLNEELLRGLVSG